MVRSVLPQPGVPANDPGATVPEPTARDCSPYERYFQVSNVAFWSADAQGRATLTAAATDKHSGVQTHLDTLEAQAEFVHPDDRPFAITTWSRAITAGEPYDIELRARSPGGGEHRWTRLRAFPDVVDGAVMGWYGTTEDIHERHLSGIALAESEARFRRLADDIPVMVWLTGNDGRSTYLSRAWYDYTGQTPAEAEGYGWMKRVHPGDGERLEMVQNFIAQHRAFDLDFQVQGAGGEYRWMHNSGRTRRDEAGAVMGYAGCLTDIHARKVAERELAALQQRLSQALDGTGVGVWEWDAVDDEVRISSSALSITGYRSVGDEYQRVEYSNFVHPGDLPRLSKISGAYVAGTSDALECEVRIRTRDGGWIWVLNRGTATARDVDGRAIKMVGTLTNIEASKRAEARLRWTVEHDALTGLGNRIFFQARLEEALAEGGRVALALLDVDEFKSVNDVHGHVTGDALLVMLASRLRAFVHDGETVARLGGDEFTIVLPGCGSDADVIARLTALRVTLAQPFEHDGQILNCGASIGVSIADGQDADGETLLKHADIAMYAAKDASGVALFDPSLAAQVNHDVAARERVRCALRDDRVTTVYQPIVRVEDEALIGVKALIRLGDSAEAWDPCDLASKDADAAVALGQRMLEQAFGDYAGWAAIRPLDGYLAINVSAFELRQPRFAARLLEQAAAAGLRPAQLRVGIAEAMMRERDTTSVEAALVALRDGGAGIILDDFGTGLGGMSLLKRLPLTALKIAPGFVAGVDNDSGDKAIVRAAVDLGRAFGLCTIADGVSRPAQVAVLRDLGCNFAQGPQFHGVLPAEDVRRYLAR